MAELHCSELLPELTSDSIVCEADQALLLEEAEECGLQVSEEYIRGSFVDVKVVLNVTYDCVYCVEGLSVGPRT